MSGQVYKSYIDHHIGPWFLPQSIVAQRNANEFHIVKSEWENRQRKLIMEHVKKFDYVLQAGGWVGVIPRILSHHFKNVYTFEPSFDNFKFLVANIAEINNIRCFNAALSNSATEIDFEITQASGQCRIKSPKSWDRIIVNSVVKAQTLTIDSLNLPGLDLLMLDSEGHSLEILQGAIETIKKYKPVILTDTHFIPAIKELEINYVQSIGYNVIIDSASTTPKHSHVESGDYLFKME